MINCRVNLGFFYLFVFLLPVESCPDDSWSIWYNRDLPSGFCDCETLLEIQFNLPGEVCDEPTDIQARVVATKEDYDSSQSNIRISPTFGFVCENTLTQQCEDYEVRYCCPAPVCPDTMVYFECVGCNRTCADVKESRTCSIQGCQSGCGCPNNTYFYEGKCITADSCPVQECPGDMIFSDCVRCTRSCNARNLNCTTACKPQCACPEDTYSLGDRCFTEDKCPLRDCKLDAQGLRYRGSQNITRSGFTCQRWNLQTPWAHKYYNVSSNQTISDLEENYCRNPDEDIGGPWCITATLDNFWEYCDLALCENTTCGNLGTCVYGSCYLSPNGTECLCMPGFKGTLCENDINECTEVGICNFGTCQNNFGGFKCVCDLSYTGKACNISADPCVSINCPQNSTCDNTSPGGPVCICNSGFCGDGYNCSVSNLLLLKDSPDFPSNIFSASGLFDAIPIILEVPIRFGDEYHQTILVHRNGLLYFSEFSNIFSLTNVRLNLNLRVICPFWTNFRSSRNGLVTWKVYQNSSGLQPLNADQTLKRTFELVTKVSSAILTPRVVFVTEWRGSSTLSESSFDTGTFQCILVSDGVTTLLFFVYDACNFRLGVLNLADRFFIGYINSEGVTNLPINILRPGVESNIGCPGVYGYVVSESAPPPAMDCTSWFRNEILIATAPASALPCPWTAAHCRRDFRWTFAPGQFFALRRNEFDLSIFSVSGATCYQPRSFRSSRNIGGFRCCYNRRSGRFLPRQSWYQRIQIPIFAVTSLSFEYNRYVDVEFSSARNCIAAGFPFWNLFISLRPRGATNNYRPRFRLRRRTWGDPHIQTIQEREYTFNGLGEYFLLIIPENFIVQARMVRARDIDGNVTEATVVNALVAVDVMRGNKVVFEVSPSNNSDVIVTINNATVPFPAEEEIETGLDDLSFLKTSDGYFEVKFSDDISIAVLSTNGILDYLFSISEEFGNNSRGLLGTFVERDGTVLLENDLRLTDRNDFLNGTFDQRKMWNYGQTWRVLENETMFDYPPDSNWTTYNPQNHMPPFLTDLVDNLPNDQLQPILSVCSNNAGSLILSCVFDLVVTGSMEIAMQTRSVAMQIEEDRAFENNMAPVITYVLPDEGQVRFTVGETSTLLFSAVDQDGDNITFSITDLPGISINDTSGLVTGDITSEFFDVILNDITSQLTISAFDGLVAAEVVVEPVLVCDCSENGDCLWNDPPRGGSIGIAIVHCQCDTGFSGPTCEDNFDACLGNPCVGSCTDLPPSNATQFVCGPCSIGLTGNGEVCEDINECASNESICEPNAICNNNFMSYKCLCRTGFRKFSTSGPTDGCININECDFNDVEFQAPCFPGEICSDTVGSFQCVCPFSVNDNLTCNSQLFTILVDGIVGSFNATLVSNAVVNILSSQSNNVQVMVVEFTEVPQPPSRIHVNLAIRTNDFVTKTFLKLRRAFTSGKFAATSVIVPPLPVHRPISVTCPGDLLPPSKLPTTISGDDFGVVTKCTLHLTTITINACNIAKVHVRPDQIALRGSDGFPIDFECQPITIDTSGRSLSTVFLIEDPSKCGIQAKEDDGMLKYYYSIQTYEKVSNSVIQRVRYLNITTSCSYRNTKTLKMDDGITSSVKKTEVKEFEEKANFFVHKAICRDEECNERIDFSSKPIKVTVPDFIYYEFNFTDLTNQNFIAQAINCWTSPSGSITDQIKYEVIKNGCPVEDNKTIRIIANHEDTHVKFGFSSFVWTSEQAENQKIYLFCEFFICAKLNNTDCRNPLCNTKRRRSLHKGRKTHIASSLPVVVESSCNKVKKCGQICTLRFRKTTCSCRKGYKLAEDKKTCIGILSNVNHERGNQDPSVEVKSNVHRRGVISKTFKIFISVFVAFVCACFLLIVLCKIRMCTSWRDGYNQFYLGD